jgi:hypothetical protein
LSAVSDKRSEGDEIAIAKQSIKMKYNEPKWWMRGVISSTAVHTEQTSAL